MSRKVFISFLGSSNYQECFYVRNETGFKSSNVRYIQEATLEYLISTSEWTAKDVAYILLTKGAEKRNWADNGHINYATNQPILQTGLEKQLANKHFPFDIIPVKDLPDGNQEEEIWQIFNKVFEVIQDDDELYFDLTHGFRYLPMLILVLGNYAKFLKNVTIKSITYGNYESRNKETNEALIIDLKALSDLQDWTSSSASFITNGNITMLTNLCNRDLTPLIKASKGKNENAKILKNYMLAFERVVEDLNTCRGMSILNNDNIKSVFNLSRLLNDIIIEPMKPIIEKLKDSFNDFSPSDNIQNGYAAAKWCFDNKMYQQALTILHEMLYSHVCASLKWDFDNMGKRACISAAFHIALNNLPQEKWKCNEVDIPLIHEALECTTLRMLLPVYNITDNLRNDFNHSGMRNNPCSRKKIIGYIESSILLTQDLIKNSEKCL